MPQDRARPLGQASLIALGLNGVIGVGIFFIPSSVAAHVPGTGGAFVYLLTALACLPIALSFGRLAPRFAEDGGPYVYARAAFGPWAAFVTGWLTYVSAVLSTSAVIRGLAEASIPGGRLVSLPDPTRVTASATVIGLALLTAAGLRVTAWAWSAITVAKLVPLLMLLGAWMVRGAPEAPASTPQIPHPCPELSALLRAGLLVLFSLQGFEIVPVPAGHVQQPKAMPRATVAALVIAAMFYCALQMACVQALPGLSASQAPLVDAANVYGGPGLARVLTLGTSVSALGIALGMVAMTPRYLATLGRSDGLGSWMGACSAKGVPLRALGLTAVVTLVLVQLGSLDELFALSSIAVLAQYAATALSLVVLGARGERGLGRRDILLGVVAMVAALSVVAGASWRELVRAVAVIALGVVVKIGVAWGARHRPG
jgi:APA family basic amino acid/polyamine antiporter